MNKNNPERSEKSTSQAVDGHSESSLVAEAWSRESSPTSRSADSTSQTKSETQTAFLDMGTADSLYGRSVVEPTAAAGVETADAQKRRGDGHKVPEKAKPEQKTTSNKKTSGAEGGAQKEQDAPLTQPRMIHPDRLEDLGKTRPEEVDRYHERFKNYEHKQLEDWAKKTLTDPAELFKFQMDMRNFEARAKRDGLATADVTTTYREIQRLTSAKGETPLTTLERTRLAQQVMGQAAHPTSIDQGQHNTCNVTTVEARAYSRTPAQAARLVADIALTGEYRANDGTTVDLDPKGHHESLLHPTPYGLRSHASEIFQVTAVNLHYARLNAATGSMLRYEQVEPNAGDKSDRGERLMDYSGPLPKEVTDADGPVRSPDLRDGELTIVSNLISHRPEQDVTLVSDKWTCSSDNVCKIASKEELAAKLKDMKEHGLLPTILRVNTTAEPFYTDSGRGAAGGSGGAHVVTVTGFDEKTGMATVDNQWGWGVDHGKNNPISVRDLYTAMQSNQGIEEQLKKDVQFTYDNNLLDPAKEMQMLRLQKLNKTITNDDYVQSLDTVIENTKKSWDAGNTTNEQRLSQKLELDRLIHNGTPAADQMTLLRKERQLGIIDYEEFRTKLTFAGVKCEQDFKASKDSPIAAIDHILGTSTLNLVLFDLTPQDREWVRQNIQTMSKGS